MPKQRNREPVKLVAIRPDGSKLFGQWQYQYQPGNSANEGWVWETWVEESEHDVRENRSSNSSDYV